MTEFISDGKFMAMRAELQEQSMLLREILKALQSSGAPAETSAKPEAKTPKTPKVPKEAVGEATVETLTPKLRTGEPGQAVEQVDTGKTDTGKPYPWGTPQDAPDTKTEPVQMATRLPSLSEEQGAQPPVVPRRGQIDTGSKGR